MGRHCTLFLWRGSVSSSPVSCIIGRMSRLDAVRECYRRQSELHEHAQQTLVSLSENRSCLLWRLKQIRVRIIENSSEARGSEAGKGSASPNASSRKNHGEEYMYVPLALHAGSMKS